MLTAEVRGFACCTRKMVTPELPVHRRQSFKLPLTLQREHLTGVVHVCQYANVKLPVSSASKYSA
jgi:hypothetical protein